MGDTYISLNAGNLALQHLCCAIADKKHQPGVEAKRNWLKDRLAQGHVFRKLDAKGKVFIEYAPLEAAWVPVVDADYMYIYCLWVSGSFKNKGHGKKLLNPASPTPRRKNKSGVCVISSKRKPFLSDKKFMQKFGFETVDAVGGEYELLALSFDGTLPAFAPNAKSRLWTAPA